MRRHVPHRLPDRSGRPRVAEQGRDLAVGRHPSPRDPLDQPALKPSSENIAHDLQGGIVLVQEFAALLDTLAGVLRAVGLGGR